MLRRARDADLDRLLQIEQAAFDPALYPRMSRRQFRTHLRNPRAILKVCGDGDSLQGYALSFLHQGRPFLRFYSLAVDPAAQGGTVGRDLFADVEAEARQRGMGVLCEVRKDNGKLRDRYARLGYTAYREVADYYPDGMACVKFRKTFA